MKKIESSNSKDRVEESEEGFDNHCSFLRTHNREKLIQVTCNYFSLGQAELARATLRLLFEENREEDCIHILNSIIYEDPPSKWIASPTIPSSAHLRWFCMSLQREFGVSSRDETSWLKEGTQFDILMVCSLLDCDRRMSKQIFNFNVLDELRNCFYMSMARASERGDGVTTPRVPPLDFLPVRGYFGIHRTHLPGRRILEDQIRRQFRRLGVDALAQLRQSLIEQPKIGQSIWLSLSLALLLAGDRDGLKALQKIAVQVVARCLVEQKYLKACRLLRVLQLQRQGSRKILVPIDKTVTELLYVCVRQLEAIEGSDSSKERESFELLRRLASLVIEDKSTEETDSTDENMSMRLLRGKMYEALMCNRSALEIESESDDDEELKHVDNLSLLRSFLELEEKNLRSIMIRSSTRPVPRIFVNYENTSSWPTFWDGLASFVWSARSERCHFIEWTLRRARECVLRDRDFESARLFVRPFRPLRGLLLLLCADSFKDDIVSLQRLIDTIWSEKEEEEEETSSNQPRVERYCDQLAFRLRFTWWFAQRYKGSRFFISNEEDESRKEEEMSRSLSPKRQERQNQIRRIANRVLGELSERSFLFVMRESLDSIDEVELLRFLVDRPEGNPEDISEHERDLIVLRGYYAFRHAFRVCYSEANVISDDQNLLLPGSRDMIVTNALRPVRVR